MKTCVLGRTNVLVLTAVAILTVVLSPVALGAWLDTEDILHMNDGRELHGQILDESETSILFETVDEEVDIRMRVSIAKSEIMRIDRDVEIGGGESDEEADEDAAPVRPKRGSSKQAVEQPERTRIGTRRGTADDADLPSIYLIPMKGQMGTDVHLDIYESVVDDVNREKPDIVVWELECNATDELMISMADSQEQGLIDLAAYREIVNTLKKEIDPGVRQVMWVRDSVGVSSVMALAWQDVYMDPGGRLEGLNVIFRNAAGWSDPDVRAKMIAAWVAIVNAFFETGGHAIVLGRAMMNPEESLSATWKGRDVVWSLDQEGEYIVDNSDEATVSFTAKTAEDLCLSDGTAETIDDLALLLGLREYRLVEGEAPVMVEGYVEGWRGLFDRTKTWYSEIQDIQQGRGATDQIAALGQIKTRLKKIISAMEKYEAVETRWKTDFGLSKLALIVQVEQINEQIRGLRGGGRGAGGGGRSGGAGPGNGGG
jgi:hypothetical protein